MQSSSQPHLEIGIPTRGKNSLDKPISLSSSKNFLKEKHSRDEQLEPLKLIFDKIDLLRETIEEIKEDIKTRHELNHEFLIQIDKQIKKLEEELQNLKLYSLGNNQSHGANSKRIQIEKELHELNKEKRDRIYSYFKDTVELKEKLRKVLLEYQSLLNMKEMIS